MDCLLSTVKLTLNNIREPVSKVKEQQLQAKPFKVVFPIGEKTHLSQGLLEATGRTLPLKYLLPVKAKSAMKPAISLASTGAL